MTNPEVRSLGSEPPADTQRPLLTPAALRGIRAAFAVFTRIPVGGFPYSIEEWKWAAAHAPLVGIAVGAILGALDRLLLPLGALPAAVLVVAASLLVTGCFHEDGLADAADALGGGYDKHSVLAILKDSRIGSFGGSALVVSIVVRATLVAQLGSKELWALALVGCSARVGPIWLAAALPYVTEATQAKSDAVARTGITQALVATLWLLVVGGLAMYLSWITPPRLATLTALMGVVTLISGRVYLRRVGGITGDFLGATEQIGEIVALGVLAWRVQG